MGDPFPARQVVRIPQVRYSPSTRIPLPSHAAAAACPSTSVPPAIRHTGLLRCPIRGTTSDRSSVARETSRHGPLLSARQTCRPAGAVSRAAAQWPSRIRPPSRATATWRTVPLRRVNRMLPRDCGEARRHPIGAVTNAGRSVRQRRPKAASECGALYHPVIMPASAACLAEPLPHKAWTLLCRLSLPLFALRQVPAPAVFRGSDRRQSHVRELSIGPLGLHHEPIHPQRKSPIYPNRLQQLPDRQRLLLQRARIQAC